MVQELQPQGGLSVPEEFYNLTQLAEVTLIAGKLSTTDINEIKNYISKSEDPTESVGTKIFAYHAGGCYESTKKKWKNHWENYKCHQERTTSFDQIENINNSSDDMPAAKAIATSSPMSSSISSKSYTFLSSSCSSVSSDDDSTKSLLSYSHKVFDRKKQRTFKQSSTESDYDFHFVNRGDIFNNNINSSSNHDDDHDVVVVVGSKDAQQSSCDKHDDDILNTSRSDTSCSGDTLDNNLDRSGSGGGGDDHSCPECGKKYSTSES